MTYNVFMGTLNPTHSLAQLWMILFNMKCCAVVFHPTWVQPKAIPRSWDLMEAPGWTSSWEAFITAGTKLTSLILPPSQPQRTVWCLGITIISLLLQTYCVNQHLGGHWQLAVNSPVMGRSHIISRIQIVNLLI